MREEKRLAFLTKQELLHSFGFFVCLFFNVFAKLFLFFGLQPVCLCCVEVLCPELHGDCTLQLMEFPRSYKRCLPAAPMGRFAFSAASLCHWCAWLLRLTDSFCCVLSPQYVCFPFSKHVPFLSSHLN